MWFRKLKKTNNKSSFFAIYNNLYKNKIKKWNIDYFELYFLSYFIYKTQKKEIYKRHIDKNIWYISKDIERLIKFEEKDSKIIDYKKLSKNKKFLCSIFWNIYIKSIINIILILIIVISSYSWLIIYDKSKEIFSNIFTREKVDITNTNNKINNKDSEYDNDNNLENNENKNSNSWSLNDDNKENTNSWEINNTNSQSWELNKDSSWSYKETIINSKTGWIEELTWDYYVHTSLKDWKEIKETISWDTPIEDIFRKYTMKETKSPTTYLDHDDSFIKQNELYILKSTYKYVIKEIKRIYNKIIEYLFIKSFFWLIIVLILSIIFFRKFVRFFKNKILIFILTSSLIAISSLIINYDYLLLNIIFSIILVSNMLIFYLDLIAQKINVLKSSTYILTYYYTRNLIFWFILFLIIFLIWIFSLYIFNESFFLILNSHLNFDFHFEVFKENKSIYYIGLVFFMSSVLIRIIHLNLYSSIKSIYDKASDWDYDKERLRYLIKKWTPWGIYKFFIKNIRNIDKIKIFLQNFLYDNKIISYKHLEYLIDIAWNKYDKYTINNFWNRKWFFFPRSCLKNKLEFSSIKKERKTMYSWDWEYRIISYLDKWDESSYIRDINIKKSMKLWKIILNIYEDDISVKTLDNLYLNLYDLLEYDNLLLLKNVIKKLNVKELKFKNIYLYKWNEQIYQFKFISSRHLINIVWDFISRLSLNWNEIKLPKFVWKEFRENAELMFNIAFDKIKLKKKENINNTLVKNTKNNLLIWF